MARLKADQKPCVKCGEVKPLNEFYAPSRECKSCTKKRTGLWGKAHREQINAWRRKRREQRPDPPYVYAVRQPVESGDKTCSKCGETKSVQEFYAAKHGSDGRTCACKQCVNRRTRAVQKAHPERCAQYTRKWMNTHPEGRKNVVARFKEGHPGATAAYSKKYDTAHRKERIEKNRRWRLSNGERLKAYSKAYYAVNRKRELDRTNSWRKNNPEKNRDQARRRNVRQRAVEAVGRHTLAEWKDLCAKFENRCVCCGDHKPLTRDHIIPLSWPGSSDAISNIQPLCRSCNSSKQALRGTDYRLTPFVRKGHDCWK